MFFYLINFDLVNRIHSARDVLNTLEVQGREKRKRRDEWWAKQKQSGKTRSPLPTQPDAGWLQIVKNTKS